MENHESSIVFSYEDNRVIMNTIIVKLIFHQIVFFAEILFSF